jgi:uncharacterized membrane protein YkvA (DUF1232 family)
MTGRALEPYDPDKYARDKAKVDEGFWTKLRRNLGRIPFAEDAVAAYYCSIDPKTPTQAKAILVGALAYFILPTDLVPDFIAMVGYGDDAAVLAAAIRAVLPYIKDEHREKARAALAQTPGAGGSANQPNV